MQSMSSDWYPATINSNRVPSTASGASSTSFATVVPTPSLRPSPLSAASDAQSIFSATDVVAQVERIRERRRLALESGDDGFSYFHEAGSDADADDDSFLNSDKIDMLPSPPSSSSSSSSSAAHTRLFGPGGRGTTAQRRRQRELKLRLKREAEVCVRAVSEMSVHNLPSNQSANIFQTASSNFYPHMRKYSELNVGDLFFFFFGIDKKWKKGL